MHCLSCLKIFFQEICLILTWSNVTLLTPLLLFHILGEDIFYIQPCIFIRIFCRGPFLDLYIWGTHICDIFVQNIQKASAVGLYYSNLYVYGNLLDGFGLIKKISGYVIRRRFANKFNSLSQNSASKIYF